MHRKKKKVSYIASLKSKIWLTYLNFIAVEHGAALRNIEFLPVDRKWSEMHKIMTSNILNS